jgi:colicin import membrane protein
MNAATLQRPRGPASRHDTLPSFIAALAMHAVLVAGLWVTVQWRTTSETPAVAELWELAPVEPPAPPPEPAVTPQPEQTKPEADIVEKQIVRPRAPDVPSPPPPEHRTPDKPLPRKIEPKKPERKAAPSPEQVAREEKLAEERRQTEIARITGQAVGTARTPATSPGVLSDTYRAMIRACIQRWIAFAVPEGTSDQIYAEFKLDLLPTGEQAAPPKLNKSSGLPGYDGAAERAIMRCDPFPRDKDGTVPRSFTLRMYPAETR